MKSLKLLLIIFTIFITSYLSESVFAQDIGIFSEPAPAKKKPAEKPAPRKPTPPRKNAEPVEKPKKRVILTIISDPIECEVYLNDIYRGTTASLSGKLVIPDLDPTISYSLRIYKRGIGEEVKSLTLNQDLDLNLSLKEKVAGATPNKVDPSPDKTPSTNIALNVPTNKEPDKVAEKEPVKPIDNSNNSNKPAEKEPSNPINNNSVAANPNNTSTTPSTTAPITKPVIMPPQREMVLIPAGEVNIGANLKKEDTFRPQHKVKVEAFYIDVYEVSNADYKLFCDATNRIYPKPPDWDKEYFLTKPSHPVVNVSWDDANAYAAWGGKRLPTEEEWEKAARGLESRIWPWGKDYQPNLTNLAGAEDGFEYTAPIGTFPQGLSPYGVQDMAGNVWEWTSSLYKPYPGGPTEDKRYAPEENAKFRVIRGGGYNVPATNLRTVALRFPGELIKGYEATGFRCAKSQ